MDGRIIKWPSEAFTEPVIELDDTISMEESVEYIEPASVSEKELEAAAFDYIATGKIPDGMDVEKVRSVANSILIGTYY